MSEDRAHETQDWLEQSGSSPDVSLPADAVRPVRSTSRPTGAQRSTDPGKGHPTRARDVAEAKPAAPARLIQFLREVVSELGKVIWPTRRELVVYTAVVLVFVSFMVAFVALLDMGLGRAVLTVFG
ncbi:MAG: preprotein translocase subunit SecE [Pseudonocardiaceae bacterium]